MSDMAQLEAQRVSGGYTASIPIAVCAIAGAVGSLVFVMRTSAIDKLEQAGNKNLRQKAVARVLMSYTSIALLCLIAAVAVGDAAFIALTGISAVTAGGLLVIRRRPQLTSPTLDDDLIEPPRKQGNADLWDRASAIRHKSR